MLTFYAKALNVNGKVEQILVTKEPGKPTVPQWTGKIYKNDREANADLIALNCAITKQRRSFERMCATPAKCTP